MKLVNEKQAIISRNKEKEKTIANQGGEVEIYIGEDNRQGQNERQRQ